MAAEKNLGVLLLLLMLISLPLAAQEETDPPAEEDTAVVEGPDYYYELNEAGDPIFKQVLSWKEQKGALEYEVVLEQLDASGTGTEILRERTAEASLTVSLTPGSYRYEVTVFNLLGQPEGTNEWVSFDVIKAEFPDVDSLFPFALFMEEGIFKISVRGRNILPGAEFHMVDQATGLLIFKAVEVDRRGNEVIELDLTEQLAGYGNYRVKVVNPGGLFDTTDAVLKIRYKKPVDIALAAGWAPVLPLFDGWFTENWNQGFYPLGFVAHADVFFLKRRFGFLGAGITGRFAYLEGGTEEAALTTLYAGGGLHAVYMFLLTKTVHLMARAGGGVLWNSHGFDYQGSEGPAMASIDFYGSISLSVQIILKKRWIIEPGVELFSVFHSGYSAGMLSPYVSGGVYF